jgi:hypothetical protein
VTITIVASTRASVCERRPVKPVYRGECRPWGRYPSAGLLAETIGFSETENRRCPSSGEWRAWRSFLRRRRSLARRMAQSAARTLVGRHPGPAFRRQACRTQRCYRSSIVTDRQSTA